jgi:hypothetical protein
MSHHFGHKHAKAFLPFVNNTVKHITQTKVAPEYEDHGNDVHSKDKHERMPGKALIDAQPIKIANRGRGQESLMYNFGKGFDVLHNNPETMHRAVRNRRSLAQVNDLDFSNYLKFTK